MEERITVEVDNLGALRKIMSVEISFAINDSIKMTDNYNLNASLLVYAEVKQWFTL